MDAPADTSEQPEQPEQLTFSRARGLLPEGMIALLLLAGVAVTLVVRPPFPLTPLPTLPDVVATLDSGTAGVETDGVGQFWWLTENLARLGVANNTDEDQRVTLALTVGNGPCDLRRVVSVADSQVTLEPFEAASVEIDLDLDAYERIVVPVTVGGDPCEPLGNDPRALYVLIRDLSAAPAG